jgi:hypothetical protein
LPCARTRRTAKTFFLLCAVEKRMTNISIWHTVRFLTTQGKVFFLKKIIFVLLLISPLQKYYFVLNISNLYMSRLI